MSKRKTPDKRSLNGPRTKKQKVSHSKLLEQHNTNGIQFINGSLPLTLSASIDEHGMNSALNAHCYQLQPTIDRSTSFCDAAPSIIDLQCHHSDAIALNGMLIESECDRFCSRTGQKVKVYWTEDKQWYHGVIRDFKPSTNESLIMYDDGESEWLNLTSSGNETVEFLVDPAAKQKEAVSASDRVDDDKCSAIHYKKGRRTSGKVATAFDHGFIANLSSGYTAIAFDNRYILKLIDAGLLSPTAFGKNSNLNLDDNIHHHNASYSDSLRPSSPSSEILKLLHFCRFDQCSAEQLQQKASINGDIQSNGHRSNSTNGSGRRQSHRRSTRHRTTSSNGHSVSGNDIDSDSNSKSRCSNPRTPSWHVLGITAANDPITRKDRESHIKLIHSDGAKSKGTASSHRTADRLKKQRHGVFSNVAVDGKINTNNITKKCNTKSILDLKAIYPLQRIRQQNHDRKRSVIVIGAGISGLSCSRELMQCGYKVTVLEARNRAGGRIHTLYGMGLDDNHGIDVGGGWIHGVERNPMTRLVERLKLTLHSTSGSIGMYDHRGNEVDSELDAKVEKEFNALLDRISKEDEARSARIHGEGENERKSIGKSNGMRTRSKRSAMKRTKGSKQGHSSLGEALESYLSANGERMSAEEHNLWHWHFSNLEYSNAADLNQLSLTHWDQDDEFALSGDHCLIQEGYGRIIEAMKEGVDIRYNHIVTKVDWTDDAVKVITKRNEEQNDASTWMKSANYKNGKNNHSSKHRTKAKADDGDDDDDDDEVGIKRKRCKSTTKRVQRTLNNLQRIELTQKKESDSDNSCSERVPIYAMVPNPDREQRDSMDSTHRFLKLQDVEGRALYSERDGMDTDPAPNGKAIDGDDNDNDDGDDGSECFAADAVVVTLPLGVLKRGDVEFVPALPSWKEAAIQSMGFGLLNKVFLRFDDVFWDTDSDYIGFASSIHGEFYLFVNLIPVTGTAVLMSLVSGSFAERLEAVDDGETVDRAMTVLRNIFGDDDGGDGDVVDPVDFCVTRWGQDRFSRGSYSFIATGCNGEHYEKLSYSVRDKLYFGGEHTIRKWPASVHGAYLSGIREARKIMNTHYIHHDAVGDVTTTTTTTTTTTAAAPSSQSNGHQSSKLSAAAIKAGLTESPTDSMFEPIKEQPLRMSARNNFSNKYSSSNRSKKKRKRTSMAMNRKRRTRSAVAISRGDGNGDDDEDDDDIGTNTGSGSSSGSGNGSDSESMHDALSCALCGGTGYLFHDEKVKDIEATKTRLIEAKKARLSGKDTVDVDGDGTLKLNRNWNRNRSRNRNRKLIGPFVVDDDHRSSSSSWRFIHFGCGLWSPDIHHQEDQWYNVTSCIRRSQFIRCCFCGEYGASVHCHNVHCLSSYHPQCAHTTQRWDFDRPDEGHLFFCIRHRTEPLSLHIRPHRSSIRSVHSNRPNTLRLPRPPAIATKK